MLKCHGLWNWFCGFNRSVRYSFVYDTWRTILRESSGVVEKTLFYLKTGFLQFLRLLDIKKGRRKRVLSETLGKMECLGRNQ